MVSDLNQEEFWQTDNAPLHTFQNYDAQKRQESNGDTSFLSVLTAEARISQIKMCKYWNKIIQTCCMVSNIQVSQLLSNCRQYLSPFLHVGHLFGRFDGLWLGISFHMLDMNSQKHL